MNELEEHLRAENSHDLDAIMKTFGKNSVLLLNGIRFATPDKIRCLHEELGFGNNGAFSNLKVEIQKRHVTSESVILEQTLNGTHTGTWMGIQPTGKTFSVAICTIYIFDGEGKLAEERVYFDRALLIKQLGGD
jgi:steroid delta-isomerase-like uncharacterized protein